MWILDTFRDGRTGYFFEINPKGLMGDGIVGSGGRWNINKSWDGIWDAKVIINEEGLSAEIEIPFRTLNFNPEIDTWGVNFQRTIRRKNEDARWSGYKRNQNLSNPVHAGELRGLKGLSQGSGLEITPYGILKNQWSEDDINKNPNDTGFDISFNFTPSLRGSFTYNTDFAEAEVDQRRVNLTRFPLRFNEKRDFFLENSGIFFVGDVQRSRIGNRATSGPRRDTDLLPFFSRRIGLTEDGREIPVSAGGRLTGRIGGTSIGALAIQTGKTETDQSNDYGVFRVRQDISERVSFGSIFLMLSLIHI